MSLSNFPLVRIVHTAPGLPGEWFSLRIASEMSGIHPEMIREFARSQLVDSFRSVAEGELFFDTTGIRRLRQIEQLRFRQRANLRTIRLIVRLLDQLEDAEHELRVLREQLR